MLLTVILGLACQSAPPLQLATSSPPERLIAQYDLDGDGELSFDEITPHKHPRMEFNPYDTDGNGTLSAEEVRVLLWTEKPKRGRLAAKPGRAGPVIGATAPSPAQPTTPDAP